MRGKSSPAKHAFAKKLRSNMTPCEKILWKELRQKQIGVWIYAQKIVYGYIVDFWCPCVGLAIELDGKSHLKQKGYDRKRDAVLRKKGIVTMRIKNGSVRNNLKTVVAMIKAKVKKRQ